MPRIAFASALFLSALLLFSIQPMIAKFLLPAYGGTPAVWTVCMLFFQAMLLLSYGYVWGLSHIRSVWGWRGVHLALVVLSLLGISTVFKTHTQGLAIPEWAILSELLRSIGIPVLVIGASAPLLQFAYSQTRYEGATDPYFLYRASNLGSLLILLSYPWLIEQHIGLAMQYLIWHWGYVLYLGLLVALLLMNRYHPLQSVTVDHETYSWRDKALWVFLGFVPCSLMLGVTLYITTDVAATPLFWVLPLALYLLTFVLAFSEKPLISLSWVQRNALFFMIFPVIGFILGINQVRAWQTVLFHLLCFFMLAMLCHGTLYARRPKAQGLTLFYFCMSLGGVLAGLFNGLLAPYIFNQVYEYPIALALSLLVIPQNQRNLRWWVLPGLVLMLLAGQYVLPVIQWPSRFTNLQAGCLVALVIIVAWKHTRLNLFLSMGVLFGFIFLPVLQEEQVLLQARNFYGVKQVLDREGVHVLISQSTVHGLQPVEDKTSINGFRSYYGALEHVMSMLHKRYDAMDVTIMGLGAGTMVCQHRADDRVRVIEIDEQMIDLARNSELFTYLRDCPSHAEVIKADGRLAISELPPHSQQVLVLDAFNSDAIPVHLMTLEAFSMYKSKLKDDGVMLVNVSNRHLQVLPVLNAIGRELDYMVFYLQHKGDPRQGQFSSEWVLLTSNQDFGFELMNGTQWRFIAEGDQMLWTDDFSNILPLVRWH